ncbi:hypothetical protein CRYUN_Cryun26dG0104300 [Craigia yunnanensis]
MVSSKSIFVSFFFLFFLCAFVEPCGNRRFNEGKTFDSCNDFLSLNCSLHWNYHSSSHIFKIAFRQSSADQQSRWIAWAINLESKGMVGSQALVAFQRDDGTLAAYILP